MISTRKYTDLIIRINLDPDPARVTATSLSRRERLQLAFACLRGGKIMVERP